MALRKDCYWRFGVHVLVTFQRREDVQMFSEVFILKSRPGTWGNNLNVFIVFY